VIHCKVNIWYVDVEYSRDAVECRVSSDDDGDDGRWVVYLLILSRGYDDSQIADSGSLF
jgi:hypothetical protein